MTPTGTSLDSLLERLESLPAHPTAAMQVLWMADDTASSSEKLAGVVSADPTLTARIMRTANSAYYGLSGRVSNAAFAITVLGFSAVRAIAAAAAAGLMGDDEATLPAGFWSHAAAVASASSLVAKRTGADRNDAFSLGLLHDVGQGLLHRVDPEAYADLCAEAPVHELPALERERFGIDHAEAAAAVLRSWRFPGEFVEALASHHLPPSELTTPLARSLAAGEAIAELAEELAGGPPAELPVVLAALRAAGIDVEAAEVLAGQVLREADGLATAFGL